MEVRAPVWPRRDRCRWVSGVWHHLAFTRSDETAVLYMDGRPVGTASGLNGGSRLKEILFFRLGSDEAGVAPLRGWLDEIEIYNRPLSAKEVAERSRL